MQLLARPGEFLDDESDMKEMVAGVLIGLVSSAVAWIVFVIVSHPRLRWSKNVVEAQASDSSSVVHQVKLLNLLPWSCVSVQIEAFLVVLGAHGDRIIIHVPIRGKSFPLIGGSAAREYRRKKYGWLGSSHRILTIYLKEIPEVDVDRLRSSDASAIKRCHSGDLGALLNGGAELVVSATATDGLFLGQFRRTIAVFRSPTDLMSGAFERGRSTGISRPSNDDGKPIHRAAHE
jgi:hypothetical protein